MEPGEGVGAGLEAPGAGVAWIPSRSPRGHIPGVVPGLGGEEAPLVVSGSGRREKFTPQVWGPSEGSLSELREGDAGSLTDHPCSFVMHCGFPDVGVPGPVLPGIVVEVAVRLDVGCVSTMNCSRCAGPGSGPGRPRKKSAIDLLIAPGQALGDLVRAGVLEPRSDVEGPGVVEDPNDGGFSGGFPLVGSFWMKSEAGTARVPLRLVQAPVHLDGPLPGGWPWWPGRFPGRLPPDPVPGLTNLLFLSQRLLGPSPRGPGTRRRSARRPARGGRQGDAFRSGGRGQGAGRIRTSHDVAHQVIRCVQCGQEAVPPRGSRHAATLGQTLRVWKTLRPALQIPGHQGVRPVPGRGCLQGVWAGMGAPPNAIQRRDAFRSPPPTATMMASRMIPRISAVTKRVRRPAGSSCSPQIGPPIRHPVPGGNRGHQAPTG